MDYEKAAAPDLAEDPRLSDDQRTALLKSREEPSKIDWSDIKQKAVNGLLLSNPVTFPYGLMKASHDAGAANEQAMTPPPAAVGDWPSQQPQPMPPPQPGQPPAAAQPPGASGAQGSGGPPVDWQARAREATGGNVSTGGVDLANAQAAGTDRQSADVEGAIGQNAAATGNVAMTADEIAQAHHDTQMEAIDQKANEAANRSAALDEQVANGKIDSDRKWNSKSTGGKILSQLAVAFGALGQAFGQKQNIGLDNLHKSIDDDVEEQKRQLQSKKEHAGTLRGLAGEYHKQGLDLDASLAKAKAAHWDDALKQSQIFVDEAKGPQAQAVALQKQDQIRQAAAQAKMEADKQTAQMAFRMKSQAAAAAASARAAAEKQAYDRSIKEREERRADIDLGLKGEKNNAEIGKLDADAAKEAATSKAGKQDPAIAAAVNAGEDVAAGISPQQIRANNAWNGAVSGVAHKTAGARTPEAQKELMGAYMIHWYNTPAQIAEKRARFIKNYGHLMDDPTAGLGTTEKPPEEGDAER